MATPGAGNRDVQPAKRILGAIVTTLILTFPNPSLSGRVDEPLPDTSHGRTDRPGRFARLIGALSRPTNGRSAFMGYHGNRLVKLTVTTF